MSFPDLDALRARLGVDVPAELLRLALTHPSATQGRERTLQSNQRLEFLGDAIVGAIVAAHQYNARPHTPEGELTQHKIALVRRETLAKAAQTVDLGAFLIMSAGEEKSGGRKREGILADAFEAVVGAVFLHAGWNAASDFALRALENELLRGEVNNAKNLLQERTQAIGLGTPTYRSAPVNARRAESGFSAEVLLQDEVRGRGVGKTKKDAELAAAQAALDAMGT